MGFQIESGDQYSYSAKVNKKGQLRTCAESVEQITEQSEDGNAYYIPTDFINLTTTASYNGILYLRNISTNPFMIYSIHMSGTVAAYWKLIKLPTAGTLISGGTALVPVNINFSSGSLFSGTVLKGANALTVTDGTHLSQAYIGAGVFNMPIDGALILPQNTALAISCKPSATGDFGCTLLGYYHAD